MASYDLTTTIIDASNLSEGDILNCPYSGAAVNVSLPEGKYKLEVWGAQGGTYSSYYGGAGGYASGEITLAEETTTFYLYAGGQPATTTTNSSSATSPGGFNGGGAGKVRAYSGTYTYAQGGGGGSDIRIGSDNLYARVIVAGGGGGSASVNALATKYGGGESGGCPGGTTYVGTQTAAGSGGSFGTGGASGTGGYNYKYGAGGGGGGWYGGGASTSYTDSSATYRNNNGGGSGYVYTSATAGNYPAGCLLNNSYYLENASNLAGNTSFKSPTGATETGHSGNGYVRITVLELAGSIIIEGGHDIASENISNLNLQVGDVLYCGKSGKVFSAQLPGGKYKLEVWGAQGGSSDFFAGGLGGYSYGDLTLYANRTNIYFRVGGKGKKGTVCDGGFNGGGKGYSSYDRIMCSGGGGTDIRLKADTLYNRVIVAGGGGGAAETEIASPVTTGPYSYGGGLTGGNGAGSSEPRLGHGGTQNAGGAARTETTWDSAYIETSLKGSFGQGGGAGTNSTQYINGAGGGWFGGGAGGPNGGAGGGSGFVYTKENAAYTSSTYTGGTWQLNTSHYLENANTIAGNTAFTSPLGESETGHEGNGFIKITVLSTETPNEFDATQINIGDIDLKEGNIINCPYSGSSLAFNLPSGKYKFECWGAQGGGGATSNYGGKGGYSAGEYTSLSDFLAYAYVGGQGEGKINGTSKGGFNGGGDGFGSETSPDDLRGGGGGGTDIRINDDSFFSRIIVAGGGGGNLTIQSAAAYTAGVGGGTSGGSGKEGTGASLYKGGTDQSATNTYRTSGFGIGGGQISTTSLTICGGGGGWFGGGAGNGAGGGSGFVYTKENDKYTHSAIIGGKWKLNKEYYLENALTQNGETAFLAPNGTTETGHEGNGYVRITVLSTPFYGTRMGKDKILKMELNATEIIKAYLGESQVYDINS